MHTKYMYLVLCGLITFLLTTSCATTHEKKGEVVSVKSEAIGEDKLVEIKQDITREDEIVTIDLKKKVEQTVQETPMKKVEIVDEEKEIDSEKLMMGTLGGYLLVMLLLLASMAAAL